MNDLYKLLKKCKFLQLSIVIMLIVMANLSFGQPLVAPNNGNQTSLTAIRAISVEPVKTYEFYLDNSPDQILITRNVLRMEEFY